jgi:trans-2-enoyl-CoA reductase
MRSVLSVLAVTMLSVAFGACGDSSEDNAAKQSPAEKAQATVCAATADIGKQVDELKSLTGATVTKDAVTQGVDAIKSDLKSISGAQSDLSSDRRSEVQAANEQFASSVKEIASQVLRSLSVSDAKTALSTAFEQLATSYEQTLAPLDCG